MTEDTRRAVRTLISAVLALGVFPGLALAHGIGGKRYALSIPRWLFLGGGALVVVVSFVLVSVFAGRESGPFSYTSKEFPITSVAETVTELVRAFIVGFLAFTMLVGLAGVQIAQSNLFTLVVWVGWWVGYTFSVILIGNTWSVVNPWKTVFEWAESLTSGDLSQGREYTWGALPALLAFLVFAYIEYVSFVSKSPSTMVLITVLYSAYLWGGMYLFGKETWLLNGDPFTRLYHYLGKFAPLSPSGDDGGELRMYGVALVERDETLRGWPSLVFLVMVLYTVTFDGFLVTPEWRTVATSAPKLPGPHLTTTLLMLAGLAGFVAIYLGFSKLMDVAAGTDLGTLFLARRFALSLLPIAIAYHLAHYYTYLIANGQFLLAELLELGGIQFSPVGITKLLPVNLVWQSQVTLIILGHILGVWVAHHIALEVFGDRREAIMSQLPMLVLMVLYTMLSLWILTRPVMPTILP